MVPDSWVIYANSSPVFSGFGRDVTFTPVSLQPYTLHVVVQHPDGYSLEGVFIYAVTTRLAGNASLFVKWDKSVYQERDDLTGMVGSSDPQGMPVAINSWTLSWNNRVMASGTSNVVKYRGLYHGLWRVQITGVDFYGTPLRGDATVFIQPYFERRDTTPPPPVTGSLVYLGEVYSDLMVAASGASTVLPYQIASFVNTAKLLPGTTHVFFDIDSNYHQVDDEVLVRVPTGNYSLLGNMAPGLPVGYDYLPINYLPAPADLELRYTTDVFNTRGALYSGAYFRVRVRCYQSTSPVYQYSQCAYSSHPGGAGGRQRRWALVFDTIEAITGQGRFAYTAQAPGTIPLATLMASGLPNPIDSTTRSSFTASNRCVCYERDGQELDAKAVCAIEGLRPFSLTVQTSEHRPELNTLVGISGLMYIYVNGSALTQGSTVYVRIQKGVGEVSYRLGVTADVYNPSEDNFVLVGAVPVNETDYQFGFTGLTAWIELDETHAVEVSPGTIATPAVGPDYVYSGTYSGTVARAVTFDGACYTNPVKMTVVDVESASVVQQISGCNDPICGPTGVYSYCSVCGTEAVCVTQPLYSPAPYVAHGTNISQCYQTPEFIQEGSVPGDFISVPGGLCGDAYLYFRCDIKDTAIIVYPCNTVAHSRISYGDYCYALSGPARTYGRTTIILPVGSVAPVPDCLDILCTGSNTNGDAFVYFDAQTDDMVKVTFEGLANGVPTFGVAPSKVDLGTTLESGASAVKFVHTGRMNFLRSVSSGALTITVDLPLLNKKIVVQRGQTYVDYPMPVGVTSVDVTVQPGDSLLLDVSVYGGFTKRLRNLSTLVRWTPKVAIPRLFDTAYGSISGTYAVTAVGFTGPTDRMPYQTYSPVPFDAEVTTVNPDSLVTIKGVGVPTPEYALVRCRSVGEVLPVLPSGVDWYSAQTFTGQVEFNFYALRNKQGSHGEMDVWFSAAGDFPEYLLSRPYRALRRDTRSYRCDSPTAASRNSFAASASIDNAALPNVYADATTGQVISSVASSFYIHKGSATFTKQRQDIGISRLVEASADTQIVWAHISDYGFDYPARTDISGLVHGLNPDFIVAAGDNWQSGSTNAMSSLDIKTGAYYHDFIKRYIGIYGAGAVEQRFFAAAGNHDHTPPGGGVIVPATYRLPMFKQYFGLTNVNYELVKWPVHFFFIDNTDYMVDGDETVTGYTAQWLKAKLAASTASWKVVVLHYPPWSSGVGHIMYTTRRWPFKTWGADLLMSGHVHVYERFAFPDGLCAITCGTCNPAYWTEMNPANIWNPAATAYSTFGYGIAPQEAATCLLRATSRVLTVDYIDTLSTVLDTVTLVK